MHMQMREFENVLGTRPRAAFSHCVCVWGGGGGGGGVRTRVCVRVCMSVADPGGGGGLGGLTPPPSEGFFLLVSI